MRGVLLHGGFGTRLRPLTHTGPKQLIPIAGKPVSQWCLEDLRNSGIKEFVRKFEESDADAMVLLTKVPDPRFSDLYPLTWYLLSLTLSLLIHE